MPVSARATEAAESLRGRTAAWRWWYDVEARPGTLNMALDQALLERAAGGERWFRLYRWDPHCLSFGRHEPATRRYDRAAIEARGIDVVRRPTGGRAVWHARELTYALALPAGDLAAGVRGACLEIHTMLRDALRSLAIPADLAPAVSTPAIGSGACFAHPVGGEILVHGRKVVGSAQAREGGGLLQHGAILLQDDQRLIRDVTVGHAPADAGAPLEALLGRPLPPDELADAVLRAARTRWGGQWTPTGPDDDLLATAARHRARFASTAWTWRA